MPEIGHTDLLNWLLGGKKGLVTTGNQTLPKATDENDPEIIAQKQVQQTTYIALGILAVMVIMVFVFIKT